MAYIDGTKLAFLYYYDSTYKALACIEQRDESNTAVIKERVNTCTNGETESTVERITRVVSVNGLLTDTLAISTLRTLQDTEQTFKTVVDNNDTPEYFKAIISDLNFGHPVGEDSTFSMTMTVNGDFLSVDPN